MFNPILFDFSPFFFSIMQAPPPKLRKCIWRYSPVKNNLLIFELLKIYMQGRIQGGWGEDYN